MSKSVKFTLIGLIGGSVIEFLAAAVIQFRLLPFLQTDTVKFGRAGNPIPTDQFVAWAVPIFIGLGCLSIFLGVYFVILHRRKAE
jgi:hypothetical protein